MYCNDCYATSINIGPKDDKVVDTTVNTVRLQMSTLNNADHIDSFQENSYRLDKTASDTKSTRFIVCIETVQEKFYWYNQYGAIRTLSMLLFFLVRCPIGVMIWRIRCNKPINHLLLYDVKSKSCCIIKRVWTTLHCDVSVDFDRQEVQQ